MRIIHISDLHFGMHRPELIEPFFTDINQLKPDLIIISGDLTQRARSEQYLLFKAFLQRFSMPYVVVPGNHDIPLTNPLSRLIRPFKNYKDYVSAELDAHFTNDVVKVLGVNSATPYRIKDGLLDDETITRIKNYFSHDSGLINILFFHHNLNYFNGMHHPLNNAKEFLEYLTESHIHLVCTGHLHYATLKLVTKKQGGLCAIVHAGSLLCQRSKDNKNSFYVIDVMGQECTIEWRVFDELFFVSKLQDHIVFNE